MSNDLKDIFDAVREETRRIYEDGELENYHTELYMIAQECCYGLSESELLCLHNACEEILEDRR